MDPVRGIAVNEIWGRYDAEGFCRQTLAPNRACQGRGAPWWIERIRRRNGCAQRNIWNALSAGCLRICARDTPGTWHEVCSSDGSFPVGPSKASSFYHLACAIDVLSKNRRPSWRWHGRGVVPVLRTDEVYR